jgi:tetratricopeptide (TPR) repeat protein
MVRETQQSRLTLLFVSGIAVTTLAGLWLYATHGSASRLLPPSAPGEWIVYPTPIDLGPQFSGERKAVFRRSFAVRAVPATALLKITALEHFTIRVNGNVLNVSESSGQSWKDTSTYDIAPELHKGENTLKIDVTNKEGPPALSLALAIGEETIYSDDQWEVSLCGAAPRFARPASPAAEPRAGHIICARERPLDALLSRLPLILLFAGISAGIMAGVYFWRSRSSPVQSRATRKPTGNESKKSAAATSRSAATDRTRLARIIWLWPIALWLILFTNNQKSLQFFLGFDATAHEAYIDYVQKNQSLPLADVDWETHQPPLYYIVAASLLRTFGLTTADQGAVFVLRSFSLVLGIAYIGLVFACLREIFPDDPWKQNIGLVLAAFLPANLYMFHYVSNETMATTLATAAVYLCLCILRKGDLSVGRYALLGLCLGAAMLTKVTAILVAGVILAVLAGRLVVQRQRDPRIWLRTIGVAILLSTVVSGWHYWRVWSHFGTPLVGNYDAASGFHWWQYPGYSTLSYYFRFGRALIDPYFVCAFDGYLDGFYSTLWGDGMWGGYENPLYRPPWNYDLMAAGYLLALVPTLAILIGAIAALVRLIRGPRADLFLLLGLPFVFGMAVVYQYLRFPYYGHAKAFYGLTAAISLCAFGAWGFSLLVERWKPAAYVLGAMLGTWALTAFASFWVNGEAAATLAWQGARLGLAHLEDAKNCYNRALKADSHNLIARKALGELLFNATENVEPQKARLGLAEAARVLQPALDEHPDDAHLQTLAALVSIESAWLEKNLKDQALDEELSRLRLAVSRGPEYWQASYYLGHFLEQKSLDADPVQAGRLKDEAIDAYRQSLGTAPADAQVHRALAALLAEKGKLSEAIEHYQMILGIHHKNPDADDSQAMMALAWILATSEESKYRDAAKAVQLAERACELTRNADASCLSSLGAAYAEAGRYPQAEKVLGHALRLAKAAGSGPLAARIEKQLELSKAGKPYREIPRKTPGAK